MNGLIFNIQDTARFRKAKKICMPLGECRRLASAEDASRLRFLNTGERADDVFLQPSSDRNFLRCLTVRTGQRDTRVLLYSIYL